MKCRSRFCEGGIFYLLVFGRHPNGWEELVNRPFHPPMQGGGQQGTIQTRASQPDLQLIILQRYEFHRPAVELFDISADIFHKMAELHFERD